MILDRSKNALRNIGAGLINKIVLLVCPFVVRTVFIHTLGAEYLGVNSLFTSILTVLNLTELGFGSAVVFSMYRAIADDDDDTINTLLCFYKKVYRYVGLIMLGIGLILIPFLPHFTKGSYPSDINPTIVYLIFLTSTVLSYFMFAYLSSILTAFQRNDVNISITTYMRIGMSIIQIILLLSVKNYYFYILIDPIFAILTNVCTAIIAKKMFPQYKPVGKLSKKVKADIKEKVSGLMINKLCAISRNAFDSIFVSMFLGLTSIAIYNNYYYIMNSITGFTSIATSAIIAGAGNSVAIDSQEKNYNDMMRMNFLYMWISGWCTVCLFCLYQNFMRIWVGSSMMLPLSSVILICAYFYCLKLGDIRATYVEACGIWWQNRYRAIAEAVANLLLNYFLGKYFGINGIIVATLISLFFINFCYGSKLIYKYYFTKQKISNYFVFHGMCFTVTAIIGILTYLICGLLPNSIIFFVLKMLICVMFPNLAYLLVYRKTKIFKDSVSWFLPRIGIKENNFLWRLLLN